MQNFASEYGRQFGGVGFQSAMGYALERFYLNNPRGGTDDGSGVKADGSFLASELQAIAKMTGALK